MNSDMSKNCSECNTNMPLKCLKSAAGYYIGYFCPNCGPYERLSGYKRSIAEVENLLSNWVSKCPID